MCFADGKWLTGYNLAGEALTSGPFVADLSWHGIETGGEVCLAWVDTHGQEVEAAVFPLAAGALRSRHVITAPQNPGDYTLHVGLAGGDVRCDWLAPPADACPLAAVEVAPAQEGGAGYRLANFADVMLLLDAEVDMNDARSGDIIPVSLRWRALRAMHEDYTVFVHLVGPDGRLRGQVDMWPLQGSHPTSRWAPGEELGDLYEIRLDPDAPSGRYRVEVGWYLLATMQRLQIVGTNGYPIADSFVVGEFSVGD